MAASLRQLEYFVTVVDEGSFTAAAQALHVTQPGLSNQIQALEREFGGPLLERLPRSVRLTPAGRSALVHARASLAYADRARSAARMASGVASGELHIATLFSISVGILPSAISKWRRTYPELQVHLVEFRHMADLAAAMDAGRADVAVGPTPPGWEGPTNELGAEEFIIAASPEAELSNHSPDVRLSDLSGFDWVHFTPPSGLSQILDTACEDAGFEPRVAVRTEQGPSALALALVGVGITLVPANIVPDNFPGLLLRPNPPITRPISVYTRARPDPVTAAFVATVTDETQITPPHILRRLGPLVDGRVALASP
jgi:DNA-binding transcriptional LysR family regulator